MLPHVVKFNGQQHDDWYVELLEAIVGVDSAPKPNSGAAGLADLLGELLTLAGLETNLSAIGVERDKLPELAAAASQQWTGNFNPRPVDTDSLLELYEQAF